MDDRYILVMDAGTSLIKTVVYDLRGLPRAVGEQTVKVESPHPSWAELDMEIVWKAAAKSIREAVSEARIPSDRVAAIGITGQGDGAWMIDGRGDPVRPAALWNDGRAGDIITRWDREGLLLEAFEKNGTMFWSGSQAALLAWFGENEPDVLDKTAKIFCCKDWLNYKLTGVIRTDETDGSIPFMNSLSRRFDKDLMALLGFSGLENLLPQVRSSHEVIGSVTKEAAAGTHLAQGTPVICGMLDVAANAIGAGAIRPGQVFSILGTTALSAVVMDHAGLAPHGIGATACHAIPGRWLRILGTMSGTPNLDWYLKTMGQAFLAAVEETGRDVFVLMEEAAAGEPAGAGGVIYHPFLSGERVPFINPAARAGFYGLGSDTTTASLVRAVYEGVAFSIRDCLETIGEGLEELILVGGGAQSPVWRQILAGMLRCPVKTPAAEQLGTMGAALAAAVGVGIFNSYEEAVEAWVPPAEITLPDPAEADTYDEFYPLYADLIRSTGGFWERRRNIVERKN